MNKFSNINDIKNFVLAGNATVTLKSGVSGKHFTFKIKKAKDENKKLFFVSVLTGTDNESSYTYMGVISNNTFSLTKKSKIKEDALSYKAFVFFFSNLMKNKVHPDLTVFHSGTCGRCGRKLTTPESITLGLGPECMKRKPLVDNL